MNMSPQEWIAARAKRLREACASYLVHPAARSARKLAEAAARSHEQQYGPDVSRWPEAS